MKGGVHAHRRRHQIRIRQFPLERLPRDAGRNGITNMVLNLLFGARQTARRRAGSRRGGLLEGEEVLEELDDEEEESVSAYRRAVEGDSVEEVP